MFSHLCPVCKSKLIQVDSGLNGFVYYNCKNISSYNHLYELQFLLYESVVIFDESPYKSVLSREILNIYDLELRYIVSYNSCIIRYNLKSIKIHEPLDLTDENLLQTIKSILVLC